jgi:hypothetical protein
MASSGMLHRVAVVRTDIWKELSASFIKMTRIGELGTTLAVTNSPILVTLIKEALSSSETSVLKRATRRNIPEDAILQVFYLAHIICLYTSFYVYIYLYFNIM